jgi:hypothetical protein
VVLRTVTGVVTDRYRTHPQPGLAEATHTDAYYGCLDRTGRRTFLGGVVESQNGGNGGRLDGFELSGPYVTFVYTFGSKYGTADTRVEQYDLRHGRRTFRTDYRDGSPEVQRQNPFAQISPLNLATASNGYAAWVLTGCPIWCGFAVSLVVHDGEGTHMIASYQLSTTESLVQVTDLQVTAQEVTWTHLGERQSAPLR